MTHDRSPDRGRPRPGPLGAPERHTLLITVDRLGPTSTTFGVVRDRHRPVAVIDGLHLLALDPLAELERMWAQFTAILGDTTARSKTALPGVGTLLEIDAAEIATLPGLDDLLLLRRVRDEAVSGQWQRIVLDCSGIGDPFVLLRAPAVLHQALDRFWPRHRRIAAAAERPVLAQLTAVVDALDSDCTDIAELVTDPGTAAVALVVGADDRGRSLLPHQLAAIDVMGLALRSVHLNPPPGGPDPAIRQDLIEMLAGDVATGVEVGDVVRGATPVDRMARVRTLRVRLPAPSGRRHGSVAAEVVKVSGAGLDTVYEMSWRQRLPDVDGFGLGRVGDELLITVGGFRHPVRLPSVLRRCVVRDARFEGERLVIGFTPDSAVWPVGR